MLKLSKYLNPYRGRIVFMLVMLFLQVLGTLYLPTLTAEIVNNGIVKGDLGFVWRTGGIMLGVALLTAVISVLETYLSISSFSAVGRDLRNDLFRKSQQLTIDEFNSFGPASMITRCTHDVERVQEAFTEAIEMLLPAPVMAAAGLVLAFRKSPSLAFLIVVSTLIACVLMIICNARAIRLFSRLQLLLDGLNRKLREILTGMRDIRAYNRELYEQERTDRVFEDYSSLAVKVNRLFAFLMPLIMTVMNVCTILIIVIGGNSVGAGRMEIGDIMAMIEYASLILMYMTMGIMVFMDLPQAQTCAGRIREVLDRRKDETPGDAALSGSLSEGIAQIAFQHVSFRYADAEDAVLNDITFTAEAGKTTAVIGATGSGKTTLVNLIPRFYDCQGGTILINGTDITQIPPRRTPAAHRLRAAEILPFQRNGTGYLPQRKRRRFGRRDAPRGADCPDQRIHRRAGGRIRCESRSGRGQFLRRTETAFRHCKGAGKEAGCLYIRRQLFRPGFQDGCPASRRAERRDGTCGCHPRRPEDQHRYGRRSDRRA